MKRLIIIVLLLILAAAIASFGTTKYLMPCKEKLLILSRERAISQVGVKEETGHNDGYKVEEYLGSVGLTKGNPYCAAGQYWSFYTSCLDLKYPIQEIPILRTGSTVSMFMGAVSKGKKARPIPFIDDLIFWRKPNEWSGHVERIIEVKKAGWIRTIGFNTSSGISGSQDDGGGVYFRNRNIYHALGRMVLRGFIGFRAV